MHVVAPVPEFSAPFSYTTATHNITTVYTTQSTMNLGRALFFCVKKTNYIKYLTAGGSSDDIVHVSSVITPTLRSKNA
jgi:hypothetical protein